MATRSVQRSRPAGAGHALRKPSRRPRRPVLRYAVLGAYFPSGDVLAFRRFAASSIGPGYASVWHRDRIGRWVFYQDVMPHFGCGRYFTPGIDAVTVAPIRVVWTDACSFSVIVGDLLEWRVELARAVGARLLSAICRVIPSAVWQRSTLVRVLTAAASRVLRAGRMRLAGTTSGGYRFLAQPTTIWQIRSSRAVIGGRDTGEACYRTCRSIVSRFRHGIL